MMHLLCSCIQNMWMEKYYFLHYFVQTCRQRNFTLLLSDYIQSQLNTYLYIRQQGKRIVFIFCISAVTQLNTNKQVIDLRHYYISYFASLFNSSDSLLLDMRPQDTPPLPRPCSPASDIWWPSLETCSIKLLHFRTPTPVLTSGGYWNRYDWHMRVVRILLKCILINTVLWELFTEVCSQMHRKIFRYGLTAYHIVINNVTGMLST